uniref:Uncharacterized protein n=2 Tax=Guillardia theta TaxID=55529 RepID=A0A7S4PKL8_GUITH|mmetsp:Transcript_5612/g.19752  ORF Transcript_5612/g.19752 Transcript_5612/m.19752 type:complete len:525 (+) Transcript_5612:213-1787(+)
MEEINRDGAYRCFEEGKELLGDNFSNVETALAKITKAIYLWDEDPDFFEERGKVYLHLKDYKMAISNFKQALRLYTNKPAELKRLTSNLLDAEGLCRVRSKQFAEAVFLFSSALEVDPSNLYLHVHHSLALLGQGKTSQAMGGLMTYLEGDSEHPTARAGIHVLVAKLHKQMKNPTTAAHHIHEAMRLEPNDPEALLLYTQLKGRAGELYEEATDFLLRNEPRKAINSLNHAIELDDRDPRFFIRRGVIYRQLGQYNEAVMDLEHVTELNHDNKDAERQLAITYNQLAIELYAARDLQRALSVYNLALKHDPASSSVWVNRGDCYRELQEIGLALQDYLTAHNLNPKDKDIRIRLSTLFDARGLTYFDRGMHMEAETEFSNAIKYLPQVYHYYLHRASAAYLQGNLKQAFEDYKKVVELDPTNEIAWARLQSFGDVSELASKPAVARKSSLPSLKANQVEPKKLPHVRDRSPVRLSSGEREFYDDLIARRTRVRYGHSSPSCDLVRTWQRFAEIATWLQDRQEA